MSHIMHALLWILYVTIHYLIFCQNPADFLSISLWSCYAVSNHHDPVPSVLMLQFACFLLINMCNYYYIFLHIGHYSAEFFFLFTRSIAVAESACSIMCFSIWNGVSGGLVWLEKGIKTRFWITLKSCPYDMFYFYLYYTHHWGARWRSG
jgi:hypothetical protein